MSISRRTLLKSAMATAMTPLIYSPYTQACSDHPVRRSIAELELDDPILETYRQFVSLMKERPATDLVSWTGFSAVHGTSAGFNFCPHGNWYFLPWHRAYLRMYETACRTLTGNDQFAMPYWDWTQDRQLPRAFAEPTWNGAPNPLFDATRQVSDFASLPDEFVGEDLVMEPIYAEPNFELFGTSRPFGQNSTDPMWIRRRGASAPLEANPHNQVHCWILGNMCSAISPIDPIFMLHHGNIDRIWAQWNALGNENTDDAFWLDMEFTDNFIATDGSRYSNSVNEMLDIESLGYSYMLEIPEPPEEDEPIVVEAIPDNSRNKNISALFSNAPQTEALGAMRKTVSNDIAAEALAPLSIPVQIDAGIIQKAAGGPGVESLGRSPEIIALIKDITAPPAETTDVRIFINCDYLSQSVPTSDPHYVTTIGFFGNHNEHGSHRGLPAISVNLTATLKKLQRAKLLTGDAITVQLLPVPATDTAMSETGTVIPGEIEIAVI